MTRPTPGVDDHLPRDARAAPPVAVLDQLEQVGRRGWPERLEAEFVEQARDAQVTRLIIAPLETPATPACVAFSIS